MGTQLPGQPAATGKVVVPLVESGRRRGLHGEQPLRRSGHVDRYMGNSGGGLSTQPASHSTHIPPGNIL